MVEGDSLTLCQYIGRLELRALEQRSQYGMYSVFRRALDVLFREGLSQQDEMLARNYLKSRTRQVKQSDR